MRLNFRRNSGCATSQTTLLAVALLTFMGAGVLWSVSGRSAKSLDKTPQHKSIRQDRVTMAGVPTQAPTKTPSAPAVVSPLPATLKAHGLVAKAKLPLAFEPNRGQADARAAYVAHGAGYGLFLAPSEAILSLNAVSKDSAPENAAVRMHLEGASAAPEIAASEPLPGKTNYFHGNDPSRWVRNVPTFARVQYRSVYPGVDLVFYGKQGQLEYDFAVRSGADPDQIRFSLSGVEDVSLAEDGSLSLRTSGREVRWNKPVIYQEINGRRQLVRGGFQLLAENRVGFTLGQYDRSRDLIIDPILAFASYFGGTGNELNPQVAVDVNSNIYIAGTTSSATGFPFCIATATTICPTTPPVPTLEGTTDAFISKLDPTGATVLYTTYLNGMSLTPPVPLTPYGNASGADASAGLAVDNQGNAYITGTTTSSDFPVTSNAFQAAPVTAQAHVFISKIDSTGANLLYSSYLSGSNTDTALALAANNTGDAYILGWTQSVTAGDFPTGSSFQQSAYGATRLYFVAKFDTTQTIGNQSLKFFSYLGGGNPTTTATPADGVVCIQLPCGGIALDSTGNAYVAVGTTFTNLAVTNAYQATNHGGNDAYLAKITLDGTAILYSTYLGGSGDDVANAVAVDSSGNAYLTGSTTSADFPAGTTKDGTYGGGQDAYVAKLNNPATGVLTLTYTSYLGGSGTDIGYGIVADVNQNAYIVGSTNSSNFPAPNSTTKAAQGTDAFVAKINTSTTALLAFVSSDLLGGAGTDRATSVAQNSNGALLVAGETNSANFPVLHPLQAALSGPSDAFLANYGPSTDLSLTITASPTAVAIGNIATFTYSVKNNGPDYSTGAVLIIPLPSSDTLGGGLGTFTSTSGACAATGTTPNQTETCTLGTIASGSAATVTVGVTPAVFTTGPNTHQIPGAVSMGGHVVPGNTAVDPVPGNNNPANASTTVEFFTSTISPPSQTLKSGQTAGKDPGPLTVTLTPNSKAGFPANITLACVLPTTPVAIVGASCTFTPNPVLTIPSNTAPTAQTATLQITTTTAVPAAALRTRPTFWYALWLPMCGLALFGAGSSRRRRWISGAALVVVLGTLAWLPACGGSSNSTPGSGTQPGTYTIGITATSGSYVTPPTTSPLNFSLIVTQ